MKKIIFRRLAWILGHVKHLEYPELAWLIRRLTEVELVKAKEKWCS